MSIADKFPVFEADQVLTNHHLNCLFNFLDQHNRLTRMKLIGSGIVCGLELKHSVASIRVSKGCGLTSQGFMVTLCDTEYTHYIPFVPPAWPNDLHLITQCLPEDEIKKGEFLFYGTYGKSVYQLITNEEYNNLDVKEKESAVALSLLPKNRRDDYAVVLFLDVEETDLKNCDTNDCNDKGSRMDLEVRALLVDKSLLTKLRPIPADSALLKHVELRRYNIPVQEIKSAEDVLNAFANLVDDNDTALTRLANDLNYCWIHYHYLLKDEPTNPFTNVLPELKSIRDAILKKYPILIQYFCDFIDDLIKSFYEFKHKVFEVSGECCGDELKFPFHLMLGDAAADTSIETRSAFREYFIYSPLFDAQDDKLNEIRSLFSRMKLQVQEFVLNNRNETENKEFIKFVERQVKITPSQYGRIFLSDKAIPYYYKVNDPGMELYRYWDYDKTRRGSARFNLGYHANLYNAADTVVNPLKYDLEWNNFFRVEGHIGKQVSTALTTIKEIQQDYNLPFEVIALSADYIGAILKGKDPECIIQDLESDYRTLIAGFLCKIQDTLCIASRFPIQIPQFIVNFEVGSLKAMSSSEAKEVKNTFSPQMNIKEKVSVTFTSALVNEFQAVNKYTKGDTIRKLCNPGEGTIGKLYLQGIIDNDGNFINPVTINANQPITTLMYHIFEFLDAVESIMQLVMINPLSEIDVSELKKRNNRFETEVRTLSIFAIGLLQLLQGKDNSELTELISDLYLDVVVYNLQSLLSLCFLEQVASLKSEYHRRIAQYRLARNFNSYYKQHGGLEHKAGVPRGGTFILVYHEKRNNRYLDVHSMFVSKELGNLMVAKFQELLKPAVDVTEMEFSTQLMQVATLYRDPEMYLQFRDTMTKYLDDCKDITPEKRKRLKDLIDSPPVKPTFTLTDGMVIADFYVPYLCCSDCPPLVYMLPKKEEIPSEAPSIDIDIKKFCSVDTAEYLIKASPANGTLSGPGAGINSDGKYVFIPSNAGPGLHTITYSFGGKTASVQVEVVQSPAAKFSYTIEVNNEAAKLILKNETTGRIAITTYEWLRDGKPFSTLENPDPIEFKVAAPIRLITLNVANGDCKDTFSLDIVLPPKDPTIDIIPKEFCESDTKTYPVTVTPQNGIIRGDGVNTSGGTIVFVPADAKRTGEVELSYEANGKTARIKVMISPEPVVDFTYESKVANGVMTVQLKNLSSNINDKAKFEWTGAVTSTDFTPPPFRLKLSELPVTVNLKVTNGSCEKEKVLTIQLEKIERSVTLCRRLKIYKLEPNLSGSDVFEVTGNDGIKMDDKTLEVSPARTIITQTQTFHVSYMLNGKLVEVSITLLVIDADFIMKITQNTSPRAVFPIILSLKARKPDATEYQWTVTKADGTILSFTGREVTINYTEYKISAGSQLTIKLTVLAPDPEGNMCKEAAAFILTESIFGKHYNGEEFDSHTTA